MEMMGKSLSWFSLDIKEYCIYAFMLLLFLSALRKDWEPDLPALRTKLYFVLIIIVYLLGLMAAMCTGFTPVSFNVILGAQGRYLLPVLPLALTLLRNRAFVFKKDIDTSLCTAFSVCQYVALMLIFVATVEAYMAG